jgi:hypothetical protein
MIEYSVTSAQTPPAFLIYTQYADTDAVGEYIEVMEAINETYGTNYTYTNLTSSANLDSTLAGHSVFLILEQETSTATGMRNLGNNWESTLTAFVQTGGVVILMDYTCGPLGFGGGSHLYNASELMVINEVQADTSGLATGDFITSVSVVAAADPLATGVSASWTPSTGTLGVETPEGTVVVEDNFGNAVVIHKVIGSGHVVYLGFDCFERCDDFDQIIANALTLAPATLPIPGFPVGAISVGLLLCLGLVVVIRRKSFKVSH